MRLRPQWIVLAALLTALSPVSAHEGPHDVIHELTDRIDTHGPTARLLTSRAYEHRSLGQWNEAIADFQHALRLQPGHGAAVLGCAETMLQRGAYSEAESIARSGLISDSAFSRAALEAVLARALAAQQRWGEALQAWRAALSDPRPEVDWFLGEAECLARLGRSAEQRDALVQAMERNPSVVLHRAWVRVLVDAGDRDRASKEIETAMARSRWKSTWLLLRARLSGQRGEQGELQSDAAAALAELRSRYNPKRPEAYLVAEMGHALALLGQDEAAQVSFQQARELGVPEALLVSPVR